jgi:hypothetical protein
MKMFLFFASLITMSSDLFLKCLNMAVVYNYEIQPGQKYVSARIVGLDEELLEKRVVKVFYDSTYPLYPHYRYLLGKLRYMSTKPMLTARICFKYPNGVVMVNNLREVKSIRFTGYLLKNN